MAGLTIALLEKTRQVGVGDGLARRQLWFQTPLEILKRDDAVTEPATIAREIALSNRGSHVDVAHFRSSSPFTDLQPTRVGASRQP
jgi:hypothetical protein